MIKLTDKVDSLQFQMESLQTVQETILEKIQTMSTSSQKTSEEALQRAQAETLQRVERMMQSAHQLSWAEYLSSIFVSGGLDSTSLVPKS